MGEVTYKSLLGVKGLIADWEKNDQLLNRLFIHKAAGPDGPYPLILKILLENDNDMYVNNNTPILVAVSILPVSPKSDSVRTVFLFHFFGQENFLTNLVA